MIDKNIVKEIVETWLEDKEYFLVDIEISADDRIVVEIDHADGVWIEDCVALSRYIEEHLSRERAAAGGERCHRIYAVLRQQLQTRQRLQPRQVREQETRQPPYGNGDTIRHHL